LLLIHYLQELVVETSGRPEASLLPNRTRVRSGNIITDDTSEKDPISISCNARNSSGVSIRTDGKGVTEVSPVEILEGFRRIRSHTLRTTDDLVAGRVIGTGSGGGECGSGTTRNVRVGVENARHGKARYRGMMGKASRGLLRNPGSSSLAYILFPSLLRLELGLR